MEYTFLWQACLEQLLLPRISGQFLCGDETFPGAWNAPMLPPSSLPATRAYVGESLEYRLIQLPMSFTTSSATCPATV
jgi:hypothetical protein